MKETKTCRYCKKVYESRNPRSKYCSEKCNRADYYENGIKHRNAFPGDKIVREFTCRCCGRLVDVVDKKDQRETYCSAQCERSYWRGVTKMNNGSRRSRGGEIGVSGGMSLESLIKREKYALREW